MYERIKHMLIKEFIQVFRDPRMRMVIFVIPCIQVFVISYAISMDVKHVRTAVYDLDNSQSSRDVVASFVRSGYFDVVERIGSDKEATSLLDRGKVSAILHIMHGFADDLRGRANGRVAGASGWHGLEHGKHRAKLRGENRHGLFAKYFNRSDMSGSLGAINLPGRPDLETRAWFNENLESRNFFVPGVLVVVVSVVTHAFNEHGGGAGKRDRNHGTDHGHAHHAHGIHPRQDDSIRGDRVHRRGVGDSNRQVLV